MKKIIAIVAACVLVLGLVACSPTRVDSDVPADGSSSGSEQAARPEPAAAESEAGEPEVEEPEIPDYDPIDLKCDNPLGDAEIVSVSLKLSGVGEYEITGEDAQTIKDIAQNDARIWQDSTGWTFFDAKYLPITDYPYRIVVTLDSGERLPLYAYEVSGNSTNILGITEEEYDLTPEEFDAFNAVHDRAYEEFVDELEDGMKPYADLTLDDLTKITRVRHYLEQDQSEQILDDEQAQMVLDTLKGLEIDPSTAIFDPVSLVGGSYESFKLWFKNGDSYYVGSYQGYGIWDEDYTEEIDRFPVAMIDGVLYRCNKDYTEDMYWNYEETKEGYQAWYLNARDIPENPFESLTADEIGLVTVELEEGEFDWSKGLVPRSMYDEIVEVMAQLKYSDENYVAVDFSDFDSWLNYNDTVLSIELTSGETVGLGIQDDEAIIGYGHYTQDDDVIEALEDLIDDARKSHGELIDSTGDWIHVTVAGDSGAAELDDVLGVWMPYSTQFEFDLPDILIAHEDGYYPEGHTLDDAPLSVTILTYDTINDDREEKSAYSRLEREMEAADGEGYFETYVQLGQGSSNIITHWGGGDGDTELVYANGMLTRLELLIKGSDDFEVTPEAVLALIMGSNNTVKVYE